MRTKKMVQRLCGKVGHSWKAVALSPKETGMGIRLHLIARCATCKFEYAFPTLPGQIERWLAEVLADLPTTPSQFRRWIKEASGYDPTPKE